MKLKMETTPQGKCLEQFLSYCLLELQLMLIKKKKKYIYMPAILKITTTLLCFT